MSTWVPRAGRRGVRAGGLLVALAGLATAPAGADDRIPPPPKPLQRPEAGPTAALVEATRYIKAGLAREKYKVNGSGLTVAVLDSGLRVTHLDFKDRVAAGVNFTGGGADPDAQVDDKFGHGTHVAGIIAAGGDHTGIAPGARVLPVKVLDEGGGGEWDWLLRGLQWVLANQADRKITVVNISISDRKNHAADAFEEGSVQRKVRDAIAALRAKKVAVVVSSGNAYATHRKPGMGFPAVCPETVSVGAVYDGAWGERVYPDFGGAKAATTQADQITPFSQRLHPEDALRHRTDVFAPGAPIRSAGVQNDRGESVESGTSQAAPVVAGVILLMQEYHARKTGGTFPTVDELEHWLRGGAMPVVDASMFDGMVYDNVPHTGLSYLRVNALAALAVLDASVPGPAAAAGTPAAVEADRKAIKELLDRRRDP